MRARSRATRAICALALARAFAMASPRPRLPPVITAMRPLRSIFIDFFLFAGCFVRLLRRSLLRPYRPACSRPLAGNRITGHYARGEWSLEQAPGVEAIPGAEYNVLLPFQQIRNDPT